MRLRSLSFSVVAVLVAGVIFTAGPGRVYAALDDHETKTRFTDAEVEEARAYSNAKWQELRESENWGNVQILDALRWPRSEQASLGYVNERLFEYLANPMNNTIRSYGSTIDALIRRNSVNTTSVAKEFYAHFSLAELEPYGSRFGGGDTETLATAFDTPSRSVTFRHFQEVHLTPGLPEGMDPLQTLTVKITVPKGGVVTYLGEGKAFLPLNTFMGYDLNSLTAPTGLAAYQLSADVHLPDVAASILLRDQDSYTLTKLGKSLGLLPEKAPQDAFRVDSTGFREPVTYSEAKKTLHALTEAKNFPDQEVLKQTIAKTFTVHADKDFHIRFTGEAISPAPPGAVAAGLTQLKETNGKVVLDRDFRVNGG